MKILQVVSLTTLLLTRWLSLEPTLLSMWRPRRHVPSEHHRRRTVTFGLQAIGIGTVIGIPGSLEPFSPSAGDVIGFRLAGNK